METVSSSSKSSSVASDSLRTKNRLVLWPNMGSVITELTERTDLRLDLRPSRHSSSDEFSSLTESVLVRASMEVETTGVKCENRRLVLVECGLAYFGIPWKELRWFPWTIGMNHDFIFVAVWFIACFSAGDDAREWMLPGLPEMKAFVNDEGKELSLLSRCKSK